MFKKHIQNKLENYTQQYFQKHPDVKLIVVSGSVGKTSTKRTVGDVLSMRYKIRMHEGNHNTEIAAPLAMLGINFPENIRNPFSWLTVFRAAKKRINSPRDVDIVIQEIGGDHPGDIRRFGTYLKPDIALVTAVTPEHMEFFKTIEAVADEELSVTEFSKMVLVNREDVAGKFAALDTNPNIYTYGSSEQAEYRALPTNMTLHDGMDIEIGAVDWPEVYKTNVALLGEHSLRPVAGAIAIGVKLGLSPEEIISGLQLVRPVPGRMNPLHGFNGSTIIDDTYNSSPAAAKAALLTLYQFASDAQCIAVLGSMNELGDVSAVEHQAIGELCTPEMLSWVVVVGEQAEKYLAPAARARGCQVKVCIDAIEAAEFTRGVMEENSVVLVKGSQGGIFLEETVKLLCNMTEDTKLVRQSEQWLALKSKFFTRNRDNQ